MNKVLKSQYLYNKATKIIPGLTQLVSKNPEFFSPGLWPVYYKRAKGCKVWDLDGKEYIDMSLMGAGACILGYADKDINKAVQLAVKSGNMCTLNVPEEVELADLLIKLHPWADMVRYARTGGEAMAIAVRIARAASQKDLVLSCGYHGWHDWHLCAYMRPDKKLNFQLPGHSKMLGIPRRLKGTSYIFKYNDIKSFLNLINKYKDKIGVVTLEPVRNTYPDKKFIQAIRDITRDLKIVLVVDEITSGFRLNVGGAHLLFNLQPDIAVFAKAISNGFPMAAIIGTRDVMGAVEDTFISSTYWSEKIGPVAALTAIKKMKREDIQKHLIKIGKKVQDAWKISAKKHKIKIAVSGIYPLGNFLFADKNPQALRTLFTQLMLKRGFLAANLFYASYAHSDECIDNFSAALDESFYFISKAIKEGNPQKYL